MEKKRRRTILFGERTEKTPDNPESWKAVYDGRMNDPKLTKETLLNQKSLIVFPGDAADSSKATNGCCKSVQKMLQQSGISPEQMPHIYGLSYLTDNSTRHREQILFDLKQDQLYRISDKALSGLTGDEAYWQPFFDEYIRPLLADENGKPRPTNEIEKNLQNITFVSHCHGGFVAHQIEKMIFEKLNEICPKRAKELMGNLRMLHFSSRRPIGHGFGAKHFNIVSQFDDCYADFAVLEYDNIHEQIHRTPLTDATALITISGQEQILLLKRLAGYMTPYQSVDDHSGIIEIFAGGLKEYKLSQNNQAISLTRDLLRHFVEHPDDKRDLKGILSTLDAGFTAQSGKEGETFLEKEKQGEEKRRKILSLLSNPMARLDTKFFEKNKGYLPALRERDDEGRLLYNNLKEQYQKTGDSRRLADYFKLISFYVPSDEVASLMLLAVQRKDWKLLGTVCNAAKNRFDIFRDDDKAFYKIIATVKPEDLHYLFPLLNARNDILRKNPEAISLLLQKARKIEKVLHQKTILSIIERNAFKVPATFFSSKSR